MFRPEGIYPALLTPFDENQKVNDPELRKLLDFGIDRGLDGIFPISSVGEGIHMDFDDAVEHLGRSILENSSFSHAANKRLPCTKDRPAPNSGVINGATKNGSIPMFRRRLTVEGASLVCSVERTMCPVNAAFTAISAVSRSPASS